MSATTRHPAHEARRTVVDAVRARCRPASAGSNGSRASARTWGDPPRRSRPIPSSPSTAGRSRRASTCRSPPWRPCRGRELTAHFHCVAGWSAADLRWEGVAFETFYRTIVEPALVPGAEVTHLVFGGLDGYRSVVLVEDALADDVLLAERLDGRRLGADHGAPVRLVSPAQYGYVSTKHLCRIEVHSSEPPHRGGPSSTGDCSSPIRGRGSGRRSVTARSPAGWCGRSTGRSRGRCSTSAPGARRVRPDLAELPRGGAPRGLTRSGW